MNMNRRQYDSVRLLLTGKYLQFSANEENLEELQRDGGLSNPYKLIRKLERDGVIVGYVPVLSEKGKKMMDALKLIHDESDDGMASDIEDLGA